MEEEKWHQLQRTQGDSKFTKNLAVMIWGTETLKNRSVTGVATKKKKDALPKPPLSPSKLKIVRGKWHPFTGGPQRKSSSKATFFCSFVLFITKIPEKWLLYKAWLVPYNVLVMVSFLVIGIHVFFRKSTPKFLTLESADFRPRLLLPCISIQKSTMLDWFYFYGYYGTSRVPVSLVDFRCLSLKVSVH